MVIDHKKGEMEFDNPVWKPLKQYLGDCNGWMYMYRWRTENLVIHAYKNSENRNYIFLSDDGRKWDYTKGKYVELIPF